jgi:hypothetical protein
MNASNAARAIAQGVREANRAAGRVAGGGWPQVGRLTLVELYLERASDAWHGLQVLATAAPGSFEVAPTIASGTGPLRRQMDSGYRGADYDFITATSQQRRQHRASRWTPSARAPRCARRAPRASCCASWSRAHPPKATRTRGWAARCSSCWCPPRSNPSWPAPAACCWSWTTSTAAHSLGAAGHAAARTTCPGRRAALGHPHPAAAQAAPGALPPAGAGRQRRRRRARHRRARGRPREVPGRCPARRPRPGGGCRPQPAPAAGRRPRHRAHRRQRRGQHHQRTVRAPLPHRARGRPRRAGDARREDPRSGNMGGVVLSDGTFLGPTRSAACAPCPSWCSSTAATWPSATAGADAGAGRSTAPNSPGAWPTR